MNYRLLSLNYFFIGKIYIFLKFNIYIYKNKTYTYYVMFEFFVYYTQSGIWNTLTKFQSWILNRHIIALESRKSPNFYIGSGEQLYLFLASLVDEVDYPTFTKVPIRGWWHWLILPKSVLQLWSTLFWALCPTIKSCHYLTLHY